ncbi:hypothetical protein [Anoxybacteroides rupiense]|uniref:hypothetical protein n=1 Tax=Anoxybacteroides rupiense TaxID=311460 RepID=UPI001F094C2E|nr:hypothetical protein [Anoxybacillus rupiensis]
MKVHIFDGPDYAFKEVISKHEGYATMLQVVEGAVISCTLLQRGMPGRFNQSVTIYYILINKIDDNKIKCNNKLQREDEHDT